MLIWSSILLRASSWSVIVGFVVRSGSCGVSTSGSRITFCTLVEVIHDFSASFEVAFPLGPFPRIFLFADIFKQLNQFAASKLFSNLNCYFSCLWWRCPVSVMSLSCVCAASSWHIRVDVPHSPLASVALVSHSRFVLLCCSSFVSHSSPS